MATYTQNYTPRLANYQVGNAETVGPFDIPFTFQDEDQVSVFIDGVETTLFGITKASEFSIEGNTVTLEEPVSNAVVSVVSQSGQTRQLGGQFSQESLSTEIDNIYQIIQEIRQFGAFVTPDGTTFDLTSKKVKIADPTEAGDALNYSSIDTITQQQNIASQARADAQAEREGAEAAKLVAIAESAAAEAAKVVAQSRADELYNLTVSMVRLPFEDNGYAQYDPANGQLTLYLAEGPQGPDGPQGPVGNQGPIGLQGPQGETGIQGPVGPRGPVGFQGSTGPQGPAGVVGPDGPTGAKGPIGDQGPQGEQGLQGPQGIKGPQGDVGDQGPIGEQGPQGVQGLQGEKGLTGDKGPVGDKGLQGNQGPVGDQGLVGGVGPTGPIGPQGIQGIQGDKGLTGDKGPVGDQGPVGPIGPDGVQGIQGDVGPTGPNGPQGPMGATPLGLAFGQFSINANGELQIEYYGSADDNDFTIDVDGNLLVVTVTTGP
jgi:hypothetical protein